MLPLLATVMAVAALGAPSAAFGQNVEMKLALRPVGATGSFFDLTMRPGETRHLEVDIANDGTAPLAARTYAGDVYTIVNGGFGARLRDEPATLTTRWLDYPSKVLDLPAGAQIRRAFAVAVPTDAGPGEYATSLVLENDRPIPGTGQVVLDQIVRQAVAVIVTVPGERSPALAIGAASHKVVAGKSIVSVAVANTGNIRLKPLVTFELIDAAAATVSRASVPMDTFYARTDTFVEVPLAAVLLPGAYTIRLSLEDASAGVRVENPAIALVVEAPIVTDSGGGAAGGLTDVVQGGGDHIAVPAWAFALGAAALLAVGLILFVATLRRRRRGRLSGR
ncbi:MAG TPA: hypothetical protein VFY18_14375 [Candidatus Limnocylindrales bacterium]|nr:hypothetical protein [Candidatus Limnocylindrales bacterium]